jgi:hypothetical protein
VLHIGVALRALIVGDSDFADDICVLCTKFYDVFASLLSFITDVEWPVDVDGDGKDDTPCVIIVGDSGTDFADDDADDTFAGIGGGERLPCVRLDASAADRIATRRPPPIILTITGRGFAFDAKQDEGVMVGANQCLNARQISPTTLTCRLPPGAGIDLPVTVYQNKIYSSGAHYLSYGQPRIEVSFSLSEGILHTVSHTCKHAHSLITHSHIKHNSA